MYNFSNQTNFVFSSEFVGFTTVPNIILNDSTISYKALGLYVQILQFQNSPTHKLYQETLVKLKRDGRDSVRAAMNELIDAGYIVKKQLKDEKGRMNGVEYTIYMNPIKPAIEPVPTECGKSNSGKDDLGKADNKKTIRKKENTKKENKSSSLKEEKREEEVSNVESILSYARKSNVVLEKIQVELLLEAYPIDKILQAIVSTGRSKNVENPYSYILAVLNNNSIPKQTVVNYNQENKLKFDNFTGRGIDYYTNAGEMVRRASER